MVIVSETTLFKKVCCKVCAKTCKRKFFKILQKIGEGEIVVVGSIMLEDEIEEIKGDKKKEAVKTLLYLAVITPRVGDSVKELRQFRDKTTHEEILERLKKRGMKITD